MSRFGAGSFAQYTSGWPFHRAGLAPHQSSRRSRMIRSGAASATLVRAGADRQALLDIEVRERRDIARRLEDMLRHDEDAGVEFHRQNTQHEARIARFQREAHRVVVHLFGGFQVRGDVGGEEKVVLALAALAQQLEGIDHVVGGEFLPVGPQHPVPQIDRGLGVVVVVAIAGGQERDVLALEVVPEEQRLIDEHDVVAQVAADGERVVVAVVLEGRARRPGFDDQRVAAIDGGLRLHRPGHADRGRTDQAQPEVSTGQPGTGLGEHAWFSPVPHFVRRGLPNIAGRSRSSMAPQRQEAFR